MTIPALDPGAARLAARLIALIAIAVPAWTWAKAGDADVPKLVLRDRVLTTSSHHAITAQVGHIRVPENRGRAGSRLIEVAFIRVRFRGEHPGRRTCCSRADPEPRASPWSSDWSSGAASRRSS